MRQARPGGRPRPPDTPHLSSFCSDALERSLDPGLTEWERSREQEEFVRASILYRPSTSSLASRFTTARQEDQDSAEVERDQEVRGPRPTLTLAPAQLIPAVSPVARATETTNSRP